MSQTDKDKCQQGQINKTCKIDIFPLFSFLPIIWSLLKVVSNLTPEEVMLRWKNGGTLVFIGVFLSGMLQQIWGA